MPNIGVFHPQLVHFVIALLGVGVIARVLSILPLSGRWVFLRPAATTLILLGALASVVAAKAGTDAHDPVERVPGSRDAVTEHEEWGERTRNLFLIVAALEVATLALAAKPAARGLRVASAVLGIAGLFVLYETGEHGGELVYGYAGGVGIRSGDSVDVRRLLVAGLYHAAQQDRAAGRPDDAARLVEELQRRMPGDTTVRLLGIESRFRDRNDAAGAVAALDSVAVPADNRRLRTRVGLLRADALEAAGHRDSARAVVESLAKAYPDSPRIKDRLAQFK